MITSNDINELATALAKAQGEMAGAAKDTNNPFFNHKYADLASVKDAIRKPFAAHGLSVVQFPQTSYQGAPESYEWTAKRSGEVRYGVRVFCVVSVVTRLMHSSGQWVEDTVSTMLPNGDPQSVGSAISYLRRYALQSVAGVAAEDDDAETAHRSGSPSQTISALTLQSPPQKPDGYDDWWTDMIAASDTGSEALRKGWEQSSKVHRAYTDATNRKGWEALKARAQAVDKKQPQAVGA